MLFRQKALPVGVITMFLGFAGFTASFLMLALLWSDGLGHDTLAAGLIVLPFALGSVAGAIASQKLTKRLGVRLVTLGLSMIAVGLSAVGAIVLKLPEPYLTVLVMLLPLLVTGTGVGFFVGPNTNASFVQTDRADAGIAAGLVTVVQRAGTALVIGILSALFAIASGGAASLTNQAVAAFLTAFFAGAAALVMVVSKRSVLDVSSQESRFPVGRAGLEPATQGL